MAEFSLPANSRIRPGKLHKSQGTASRTFRIYRFEPESNENPRLDTFEVDLKGVGPMVEAEPGLRSKSTPPIHCAGKNAQEWCVGELVS